jgi:hypothetical protein
MSLPQPQLERDTVELILVLHVTTARGIYRLTHLTPKMTSKLAYMATILFNYLIWNFTDSRLILLLETN